MSVFVLSEFGTHLEKMSTDPDFLARLEVACGSQPNLREFAAVATDSVAPPTPLSSAVLNLADFLAKFNNRSITVVNQVEADARLGLLLGQAVSSSAEAIIAIVRDDSPLRGMLDELTSNGVKRVVVL